MPPSDVYTFCNFFGARGSFCRNRALDTLLLPLSFFLGTFVCTCRGRGSFAGWKRRRNHEVCTTRDGLSEICIHHYLFSGTRGLVGIDESFVVSQCRIFSKKSDLYLYFDKCCCFKTLKVYEPRIKNIGLLHCLVFSDTKVLNRVIFSTAATNFVLI